ncbi:hypothetical protein NDU88_005871 [Pleurodeles waltl]|uniref:Uncharacterized protein n=1 Tax=Pleurodeles waltl TaxID=8319 RepID=A0AAV7RMA1_PLEWA|nr:hypothetical protein NDU88_005871 [Pleurodeles waltl]
MPDLPSCGAWGRPCRESRVPCPGPATPRLGGLKTETEEGGGDGLRLGAGSLNYLLERLSPQRDLKWQESTVLCRRHNAQVRKRKAREKNVTRLPRAASHFEM